MILPAFDPPGFVPDLGTEPTAPGRKLWDEKIRGYFERAREGWPAANDGPRDRFFDPTRTEVASDHQSRVISWTAFPQQVAIDNPVPEQRWQAADSSRDLQDEYCEWSIERRDGKIARVTFTCEGPEYWEFLAGHDRAELVRLYQRHVHPTVTETDLFPNGSYDPRNKWNSNTESGAMHLIQPANNLWAEINLAAGASVVRRGDDGKIITNSAVLIECSRYGEPRRNSDPHIGEVVNELARLDADITLANPVGLYFDGLFPVDWEVPGGHNPKKFWTYSRGTPEYPVRAVYEVPRELGFAVGDIKIGGKEIATGGQIADFIKIRLTGVACRFGSSAAEPVEGCRRTGGPIALEAEELPASRGQA